MAKTRKWTGSSGRGKPASPTGPALPVGSWPASRIEMRRVESLRPNERNARTHSPQQIAKIAAAIGQWGWTTPLLVDEVGLVIAGNGRLLAARQIGIDDVPVVVARGWTEAQKRAYSIADNKLALDAGWDGQILTTELSGLAELGFDLDLTGFEVGELVDFGVVEPSNRAEHDVSAHHRGGDRTTPLETTIHQGDSVEIMRVMPDASFSAIVTDPPYGLEFMGKEWDSIGRSVGPGGKRRERETAIENRKGEKWQPGSSYGVHAKNPRCMTCGKLRFNFEGRKCACETPQFHARASEYGVAMQEWFQAWLVQALRVLKPGGMLLAFGGTRTYHRLACAAEDAGFEIRDSIGCLLWVHGQGFPKSLDVSKAIDKTEGYWRGRAGTVTIESQSSKGMEYERTAKGEPISTEAGVWSGYGTALKPAWEPVVVAMKPLDGTFAENAEKHGVAGFSIDAARIALGGSEDRAKLEARSGGSPGFRPDGYVGGQEPGGLSPGWDSSIGRFPANLVLDEGAAALLDAQSGELRSGELLPEHQERGGFAGAKSCYGSAAEGGSGYFPADAGGASRFFYVAKASTSEREAGLLSRLPCVVCGEVNSTSHVRKLPDGRPLRSDCRRNWHPTVKPVDLMSHLCRLVTMPAGTRILDPFAGSGTTLMAAMRLGLDIVGIERDPQSVQLARWRVLGDNPANSVVLVGADQRPVPQGRPKAARPSRKKVRGRARPKKRDS